MRDNRISTKQSRLFFNLYFECVKCVVKMSIFICIIKNSTVQYYYDIIFECCVTISSLILALMPLMFNNNVISCSVINLKFMAAWICVYQFWINTESHSHQLMFVLTDESVTSHFAHTKGTIAFSAMHTHTHTLTKTNRLKLTAPFNRFGFHVNFTDANTFSIESRNGVVFIANVIVWSGPQHNSVWVSVSWVSATFAIHIEFVKTFQMWNFESKNFPVAQIKQ